MRALQTSTALLLMIGSAACFAAAPVDDAGVEGKIPLEIRAVAPDGGTLKFFWVQKEGPTVNIADPRAASYDTPANKWVSKTYFVAKEPATYVFEVTVTNEDGLDAKRTIVREVRAAVPPPVAKTSPDQKRKVGEKVVLSGIDSVAKGGRTLLQFQWSVKESPAGFTLPPAKLTGRQIDFIPSLKGRYVFELKVNDGEQWSDPAEVLVEVTPREVPRIEDPGNTPPVVITTGPKVDVARNRLRPRVTPGKTVRLGDTVVLDGSESVADPRDNPRFFWEQRDKGKGPIARTLTPDKAKKFQAERTDTDNYPVWSFVASEAGAYTFVLRLSAGDETVESEPVTFQVMGDDSQPPTQAPGKKPVAFVTVSKSSVPVGEEILLDGSKSISPSGQKLTYLWKALPGKPFPTVRGYEGPIARFSADSEGEFYVVLVVDDGVEATQSDPIILKFVGRNKPPVIEGKKTYECNVGDTIVLEVTVTDPENDPFELRWSGEEPRGQTLNIPDELTRQPRFRFQPNRAGIWSFKITATDNKGASSSMPIQVGVKDASSLKPTAMITGPATANTGDRITLSGEKSFNPAKKPLTFLWSEVSEGGAKVKDPPPADKSQPTWSFRVTEPGKYTFSLVVTDGANDSEPAKWNVVVSASNTPPTPPNPPVVSHTKPVAQITGPIKPVTAGSEVTLSGETSTGEGPLKYQWTQAPDGGPNLALPPAQTHSSTLKFLPEKGGLYTFKLELADTNGELSAPATYTVSVTPAQPTAPKAVAVLGGKNPVPVGKEVRISSEGSSDAGGLKLSYKWKQTAGAPATLARDDIPDIAVIPTKAGAYEFQLIVNNGTLDSPPASVAFNAIPTLGPKAVIADVRTPGAGDTITLDGTGSSAANGAQLEYRWRQSAGEPLRFDNRQAKFDVVIPAEGKYVFELTVNDGNDWSEPAQLTFTARARGKNAPPVVVIDKLSISTEVGTEVVIDASKSYDPDKGPKPLSFRWRRKGRDPIDEDGPILKFTPPAAGPLVFEVQAFDGKDLSEPVSVEINVVEKGVAPVAVATATPNPYVKAVRGNPKSPYVTLDGSGSKPEDKADKLLYTWKQVGGDDLNLKPEALAKQAVGLKIFRSGVYRFQLTVTDPDTNVSSKPVEVELKVIDGE